MPVPALVHRQIAGVIQPPRKCLDPLDHLRPVDACDTQPFGAAPQFAGVLGGDDDAVRRHPDPDRHPGSRTCNRWRDAECPNQPLSHQVTMDVGRNLTLSSEQDSDNYDSKQRSGSADAVAGGAGREECGGE